jgi:hypothetical protein
LIVGKDLKDASAMGFVRACLDKVQSQGSLILGAKAILAARLALNTLPRVLSVDCTADSRIPSRIFKLYEIDSRGLDQCC